MEELLSDREIVSTKISKYMTANGYTLSPKSKNYHALDSFVYEYINAGEVKDNLKIEINYMLRCHVLPIEKRELNLFGYTMKRLDEKGGNYESCRKSS